MDTVYKYEIPIVGEFTIDMPFLAQFLKVDFQNNTPVMWFLINTKHEKIRRTFKVYRTGHQIDKDVVKNYLGTMQNKSGLVLHLFLGNQNEI